MMAYLATLLLYVASYLSPAAVLGVTVIVLAGALVLHDTLAQRRIRRRLGRG